MAYEMVMPYHLHMPSYFLETFTEYPFLDLHRNTVREEVDKESVIYDTVRWCDFYNCC